MVIGIDEVGRGCWAGPLVAAAVGLNDEHTILGLNDSKKLTANKRVSLAAEIKKVTNVVGIGWVWPREINTLGLTKSVQLAMQRAIEEISIQNQQIIIDGNYDYLTGNICKESTCNRETPCKICARISTLVGGDGLVPAVSAASIIAKVARDSYMQEIATKYHQYGFEKHVGYGTKLHIEALSKYGITPIHRINYKPIKQLLAYSK